MTLISPSLSLLPPAEDSTGNSESSGGVVASFDLLCLPGIVMSFLDDSTLTRSSGTDDSARRLCLADQGRSSQGGCVSSGTTDSSVLCDAPVWETADAGGCASKFKVPARHAADMDLGALILLLEN